MRRSSPPSSPQSHAGWIQGLRFFFCRVLVKERLWLGCLDLQKAPDRKLGCLWGTARSCQNTALSQYIVTASFSFSGNSRHLVFSFCRLGPCSNIVWDLSKKKKVLGKSVSGSVWPCIIFLHLVKLTFIEKVIFFELKPISKFSPQRNFDKRLNSLPFCIKWRLVTSWRLFTGAEVHSQVTVTLEDFLAGGSAAVNWNRMLWLLYEIHVKSKSVHIVHR